MRLTIWESGRLARAAAWVVVGFLVADLVGEAMTYVLQARAGFWPVWFLDCIACSDPSFSLPYGIPLVGGISIPLVAAGVLSLSVLVVRRSTAWLSLTISVVLAVDVAVTWVTRFPGSWPPVVVAVLPPAAAGLLFAMAAGGPAGERWRAEAAGGRFRGVVLVVTGIAGLVMLGGWASLAVVAAGHLTMARTRERRGLLLTGLVLGYLGVVARVALHVRFPQQIGWV
jgi:hypothetical protein